MVLLAGRRAHVPLVSHAGHLHVLLLVTIASNRCTALTLLAAGNRLSLSRNIVSVRPCVLQIYSGGSVGGASLINEGDADIVMNWSGGMHHAKKGEASGGQLAPAAGLRCVCCGG
jgi:hypothetical protein